MYVTVFRTPDLRKRNLSFEAHKVNMEEHNLKVQEVINELHTRLPMFKTQRAVGEIVQMVWKVSGLIHANMWEASQLLLRCCNAESRMLENDVKKDKSRPSRNSCNLKNVTMS